MYPRVFLDRRLACGVVNFAPQHPGSLRRLTFFTDPRRERLHPNHRAGSFAAFEEHLCRLGIIPQVKVIDKTKVLVKAPVFRIVANATPEQFNSLLGFARSTRGGAAEEHSSEALGD